MSGQDNIIICTQSHFINTDLYIVLLVEINDLKSIVRTSLVGRMSITIQDCVS
jgi:hypothetical protein